MAMRDLVHQFVSELALPMPLPEVMPRWDELWPSHATIGELARSLRASGLPAQVISIEKLPNYPFFSRFGDQYALFSLHGEKGVKALTPDGEEVTISADTIKAEPIVTIPPVGTTFRIGEYQPVKDHDHDIAVFYAATNAEAELAKEQVIPDLSEIVKKARRTKKEIVFVDAVGLIPEEVIHRFGLHDDVAAFARALDAIKRDLARLQEGQQIYEARSPLWKEVYDFLAKERIRAVAEEIPQSLMEAIHEFDKRGLAQRALSHLIVGQIDEAAEVMSQYLMEFHQLNCTIRNQHFAQHLRGILDKSSSPLTLIVLREIGHYGSIEANFQQHHISTKIVGHEKFTELIGLPSYVNFGVELTQEARQIDALRYCLKTLIASRIAGGLSFNELAARLGESAIDHLSRATLTDLITALHHPARVFLRSTPHDQPIQDQLLYLLAERSIIPWKLIPDPAVSVLSALKGDKNDENTN